MINLKALLIGMFVGVIAQVLTFFQLQGYTKFDWFKNNYWVIVSLGIPISMAFMYSVKNMVIAFDGQMWPSRLIGFSIGTMVFTWLSWYIFDEPMSIKTLVCLFLSVVIMGIQLFF